MKKMVATVSLAALAACGGGEEKSKAKAEPAREMSAGQWQSRLEVTAFEKTDDAPRAKLNLPVGTRIEGAACIGAEQTRRPPPELFVGPDFENCEWTSGFYMANGAINAAMICRRDGVGEVEVNVNVTFTGESFEGDVSMNTRLPEVGDARLTARAQGRLAGAQCAPQADGGNNQSAGK
jgi:hypothetical protein